MSGRARRSALWSWRLWSVLLIWAALWLRLIDLDGPSMWSDEGLSFWRARQTWSAVAQNTIWIDGMASRDTNPALYFLLLHGWRELLGESIWALRLLSVLAGVVSAPLLTQLGRRLFGPAVGLAAAALLAIAPLHVWQSQELRNYSLLLTFNLAAVYGLARLLTDARPRRRWAWLWIGATLAGVYTHYFGLFVLAFGAAAAALGALQRRAWRPTRRQWAAVGVLALLLVPVIWTAFGRFRAGQQVDFAFVPLRDLLRHLISVFGVGLIPGVVQPWVRAAPALALWALGVWSAWRNGRPAARLLALGYLVAPLGLLFLLSLFNPLYNGARHLLIGLPPFLLCAATAVRARPNRLRPIGLVLLIATAAVQINWLRVQFTDPALVKDDIKGVAAYLNAVARPDDRIILHDTIIRPTFDAYYSGAAPVAAWPRWNQFDRETILAELEQATAGARRVWFLAEPTPRTGFDRVWLWEQLDARWPRLAEQRFAGLWLNVLLVGYTPQPTTDAPAAPLDLRWGEALALDGWEAPPTAVSGGYWQPVWQWRALAHTAEPVTLSLRWLDEQGVSWAQIDFPLWPAYPPSRWPAGQTVRYEPPLRLPTGLPPGPYAVWLRVVRTADGRPLPLPDGAVDALLVPRLEVLPARGAPQGEWPPHTPPAARIDRALSLVGVFVPPGQYRPGHLAPVDFYWEVRRAPTADYRARLELRSLQGETLTAVEGPLTRPTYPAGEWQAGDRLHGRLTLTAPALAAGEARLFLTVLDAATGRPLGRARDIGRVEVVPWPLETAFPPIAHPGDAVFGEPPLVAWRGYALNPDPPQPGAPLEVALFWQPLAVTETAYLVFVHLTDAQGQIAAQSDGVPLNGLRMTTSWRPGEALVDRHTLWLPADLPPGRYDLWTGFYRSETFERLPAAAEGVARPDGRLPMGSVVVREP